MARIPVSFTALLIFFGVQALSGCSGIAVAPSDLHIREQGEERRVIELVNAARAKGGRCGNAYYRAARLLHGNDTLGQAALEHSRDMARNGFLGHTGSDGSNPGTRIAKLGYKWQAYGENVGQGYRTPEEAVRGWLRSEAHCRNIMNPEFSEAGAASAKSGNLRTYWTLVFGAPRK